MEAQVVVIGGGLAGAMSALRARALGRTVVLVRRGAGATDVSPGLIDLEPPACTDPEGIDRSLTGDGAGVGRPCAHPYHLLAASDVPRLLGEAVRLLQVALEPTMLLAPGRPVPRLLPTVAGAVKRTDLCQRGQAGGDLGGQGAPARVLVVAIDGVGPGPGVMPSARAWRVAGREVSIAPASVDWPTGGGPDASPLARAREAEREDVLRALAGQLTGATPVDDVDAVAFPPILGVRDHARVVDVLSDLLGRRVFELVPAIPSVPGMRLAEALETALVAAGVELVKGRVTRAEVQAGRVRALAVVRGQSEVRVHGDAFVLATGKFAGGGLVMGPGLLEPVLGLPVWLDGVPVDRPWALPLLARHPLDPHPLFRAGVAVGPDLRPLADDGGVAHPNVFAAGAVLAGLDAVRGPCGGGAALLTGDLAGRRAAEET